MSSKKPIISSSFSYETLEEKLDIKPKGESLLIGIPRETVFQENRVPLTPEGAAVLIANGHRVMMESNAGVGSNYKDRDYSEAGVKIVYDKQDIFNCDVIVKSGPVSEEECELAKPNCNIISPIHIPLLKTMWCVNMRIDPLTITIDSYHITCIQNRIIKFFIDSSN